MNVAVLGTGALGCVFAAQLAARAEVWMLGAWAEGIAAVQRDGISIHAGTTAACGRCVFRRQLIRPISPRLITRCCWSRATRPSGRLRGRPRCCGRRVWR